MIIKAIQKTDNGNEYQEYDGLYNHVVGEFHHYSIQE